jgi:phosphoglycerol transferase MdoB-like AlkP superfamily enzyme
MNFPAFKRSKYPRPAGEFPPGPITSRTAAVSIKERIWLGFLDRLVFTAIWLPVGALGVYAKTKILGEKQWSILAIAFHRASTFPAAEHFTVFERSMLFSSDCVLGFAVVPFALCLLLLTLPRKLWSVVVASVSIFVSFIVFLQMQSFKNVGHFIPWYLISDSIHWARQHPQYIIEYLNGTSFLKWVCFVGTVIITAIFLHRSQDVFHARPLLAMALAGTVAACAVAGLLFGASGITSKLARTWYGRAAIPVMLSATLLGNEDVGSMAKTKSADALGREYAVLASSKKGAPDRRYWARAGGFDVIVLILETAPAKYDSFESLDDLPTLRQLAQHSWIGSSHYSTFPYTSKATFSILTSMYPPNPIFFGGRPRQAPGLVRALASAGYETRYYVPHGFETHFEDAMYAAIGFDIIRISKDTGGWGYGQKYYEHVMDHDVEGLQALMRDAHDFSRQDRRYLAVFSPQIGHAPWPDVLRGGTEMSLGKRARALVSLQDEWLGQLVRQLSNDGRLDKTIIVVTGDHGVRTANEDPSFEPHGLLADITFHVPLLIFAPQILRDRQVLHGVTSHVDVAPTVLDLLGITQGREFEQGLPVWESEGNPRKVFLWAGDYLGAEGFAQGHSFAVWNKVADYVFTGPSLAEDVLRLATVRSAEQSDADECLKAMAKLNGDWWVSAMPPSISRAEMRP